MNYENHYNKLIKRAKNRLLECYTERHHIVPKCMGGSNENSNLVRLTAEEHYVAHQLLIKIYPDQPKLIYALNMMLASNDNQSRNNKSFGWIRRKHADEISKMNKGKPSWNKGMTNAYSIESRKKISESLEAYYINNEHPKGMLGKKHSKETKKKISDSGIGNRNHFYGKHHTEEAKKKISLANKGRVSWMKGKTHTNETRAKLSKSLKGRKAPNKDIPHSAETKAKISASKKGRSWVEMYGKEIADRMKYERSEAMRKNNPNRRKIDGS